MMHGGPLNRPPEPPRDLEPHRTSSAIAWIVGAVLVAFALGLALWGALGGMTPNNMTPDNTTPNNQATTANPNTTGSTPSSK